MKSKRKHEPRKKAKLKQHRTAQLSPSKKRIFTLVAVCLPMLILLMLELVLRLAGYGGESKLFVPTPDDNSRYLGINWEVSRRYFVQENFRPTPRKDLILRDKPEEGFRIFVLGGSTTAGFPYGHNLSFPRILQRRLQDTFPEREIEIMNTAMTAINTYTQLDFMEEILEQKPDAILIYTGHNEFYGALGVGSVESLGKHRSIVLTYLNLQQFKTFLLIRDGIHALQRLFGKSRENDDPFDPMKTEMARIVREKEIPLNHELYRLGEAQFRANLDDMVRKARKADIPVLISTLVSNVRDQAPFVSVPSDTLPPASAVFLAARERERAGDYKSARTLYYRAKDLDALRFRATEAFNAIIHDTAELHGCIVVPMKSEYEAKSPHGLIGKALMYEHLHPNYDGYFVMADAFYKAMHQNHLVETDWPAERIRPAAYYHENWGFTRFDSVYAALTIRHLKGGWPFQKTGPNRFLQTFEPQTQEDSLALRVIQAKGVTPEMAHLQLAKRFTASGEMDRALEEYRSLIYSVPYLDLFYEPAIQLLIRNQAYQQALQLLSEGLKYNKSPFIHKWIGQLALTLGDTKLGIVYLEKARPFLPEDVHLLYNLARGYYHIRLFRNGDEVAAELKTLVPEAEANTLLAQFRQRMISRSQ